MPRDNSYLETLEIDTFKAAILVLEELENAAGPKVRKGIVEESKSNPVLQEFFLKALGTDKYYVRFKEDVPSAENGYGTLESFKSFLIALDALTARRVTGNTAREKMTNFLAKCHPRVRKWYLRVLDHDLRIGVGRTTIEKIYGSGFWTGTKEGEFHYHGCCLAKDFEKVVTEKKPLEFPVTAEFKLDGERALLYIFPDEHELQVHTRGLLRKAEIEGVESLIDQCIAFAATLNELRGAPKNTPLFLDGEFLATDWNETSSVVSKTETFDEEDFLAKTRVILFDWAPVEDYMKKKYEMPWKDRKQLLMRAAGATRLYAKVRQATDNLYVLGHKVIPDAAALDAFHAWSLDGGFEGTMIKMMNAPHVFDRAHKYVLKLKPVKDETATIVGTVAGTKQHSAASPRDKSIIRDAMVTEFDGVEDDGYYFNAYVDDPEAAAEHLRTLVKDDRDRRISTHLDGAVSYRYSERLGAFVVDLNGEKVNVGGGFLFKAGQDERMEYWQRRAELVGVKVDIKLQGDKVSVAKARFNRFVRLRWDLTESSNSEEEST